MKRELRFFIDLFIENCENCTKDQQIENIKKLYSGTYIHQIGEHFAMVVLKTTQGEYKFSYINIDERKPVTYIIASIEDIRKGFSFMLSN